MTVASGEGTYRWTEESGTEWLGDFLVSAMSADRSQLVIVGNRQVSLWSEQTGLVQLGGFPQNVERYDVRDVSADASVIVGAVRFPREEATPFVWTEQAGRKARRDTPS